MLLIDAYMNLHYAVSKVWSQNVTLFAFMTLFGKKCVVFQAPGSNSTCFCRAQGFNSTCSCRARSTFLGLNVLFFGLKVLVAHVFVGLEVLIAHVLVRLDQAR